jgi:Ca2+-binding EF-hand superfamily protein
MVTAASPADAVDDRGLEPLSPEAILEKVKQMILSRGANSIRGLGRAFRIMDDAGDGKLDQADFKYGLKDYGVHLSDEEFKLVMTAFDRDGDGYVGFTEFLTALRGELNDRRRTMVGMAYDVLDKDGSGLVTLEDIKMAYDATSDPRVAAGEVSEDAVLREFMSQWDTLKADGIVTREEFEEYYGDISASIDDDDYFELMIRNAWHIMGGEGWSANTANRRVLVTHSNGSQEVVAIHNDLGIGADDLDAMRAALEKQGVRDIVAIETSS